MKCRNCGAENRDDAKFCRDCGKPLNETQPSEARISVSDQAQPAITPDTPAPAKSADVAPDQEVQSPESAASEQSSASVPAAAAQAAPARVLAPIAVGSELGEQRYVILEIISVADDLNVYRAQDTRGCPACRAENSPDDQFCINCGRELTDHPTVLLEERAAPDDPASVAPPAFVDAGRIYVAKEEARAADEKSAFPRGVHLSFGMQSDVGLVRGVDGVDEDSVFAFVTSAMYESVARPTLGLFIVADGIGGSEAGEVASKKAVGLVMAELFDQVVLPVLAGKALDDGTVRVRIENALTHANTAVWELAQEKGNDMGSTITLALGIDDRAYVANVGDSRTYLFEGGKLPQITHDHSLVASLVAQNMIQPKEIYTHPQRNLIFRSLGGKPEIVVDIFPQDGGALQLKPGSRLLLCCDGLWEMLRTEGIEELLLQPEADLQKLCDKLVARANEAGGEDNISLIVVSVNS